MRNFLYICSANRGETSDILANFLALYLFGCGGYATLLCSQNKGCNAFFVATY